MSDIEKYLRSSQLSEFKKEIKKFSTWLQAASDHELFRIDAYRLADELKLTRRNLLRVFILLVNKGAFDLVWEFHCTECNGIAVEHGRLSDATYDSHCKVCNLDFTNTLDQNVKVSFRINPNVRQLSPSVSESFIKNMMDDIQTKGSFTKGDISVSGLDCINIQEFRDNFGDDVLSLRENLDIRHIAILFSDIKDSVRMYSTLGDSRAYNLVRDHFSILIRTINDNNGILVKTIGDAIMATFPLDQDAVNAGLDMQNRLRGFNERTGIDGDVLIKVGIHAGPCIAVNLNDRMDFFGNTVNIAARVQSLAKGGEILFTEKIFNISNAGQFIHEHRIENIQKVKTEIRGIEGKFVLYRVKI